MTTVCIVRLFAAPHPENTRVSAEFLRGSEKTTQKVEFGIRPDAERSRLVKAMQLERKINSCKQGVVGRDGEI
jgi:hypothetical protein